MLHAGFSLVVVSGGHAPAAMHRLLLLWSTGSRACRLQQLRLVGSAVAAPRFSSTDPE